MPHSPTPDGDPREAGAPSALAALRVRDRLGGRDPRIVVLDDDPVNLLLLERMLKLVGYANVVTRTDPRVATAEMLEHPPDLLLLDMRMPDLDGYEVLERLRGLLGPPHELAVLVLTADSTVQTRHRALAAGARDFLTKPFDLVEVALRTANLLETVGLHHRIHDQNARLETAVGERTSELGRLAADLAHEVRTPLYAIRGLVEVLVDFEEDLPAGIREDLTQIDAIAQLALDLVNVEIRGAREAADRPVPGARTVDVATVLDDLRVVMGHAGPRDGARLVVGTGAGLPPIVTDPARVGQILRNLVANALRADADGPVEVSAALTADGSQIAFAVSDHGPGVPAQDREVIFRRFTGSDDRPAAGGLGLHISRRLARSLGGDITVTGPPDGRSCFTATIATRIDGPDVPPDG